MRVVHAVRSDGFAGVERHVVVLARAQADVGHRVAVIGGDAGSMLRELPDQVSWTPARSTLQVARALVRQRGVDVVHAHMTAAEAAAAVTTPPGVPLVATRHFGGRRGHSPGGVVAQPLITRRLAAQIAISRYVADRVDGPTTVVYPGTPAVPVVTDGVRRPWILAAQRLEAEKRVDIVIRSYALSKVAAHGWRLLVAGDGSQRAALEALADREGVRASVDFLGHHDDVAALMARSSLFLSACAVEGLGLAVVEAMSASLPVVATAAGGHLETVGLWGETFLFPPGDAVAAARALAHLVSHERLRLEYGAALARVQQERFTPERQERDTRRVYEQALA